MWRRFASFFASGQPPSTSLRPPSITGCRSTSLRWWTLSRRVPTPCSRVGRPLGLCLSSLRPPFSGPGEGPTVQRVGVDVDRPVLAATSLVPGPSRASGGDSLLPATTEGSSQTAQIHHYHQNLPVLQLTAWRISSDPHAIPDSLRRWLVCLSSANDAPRVVKKTVFFFQEKNMFFFVFFSFSFFFPCIRILLF